MKILSRNRWWWCYLCCIQLTIGCGTQSKEPSRVVGSPPSAQAPSAEGAKPRAESPQPSTFSQPPPAVADTNDQTSGSGKGINSTGDQSARAPRSESKQRGTPAKAVDERPRGVARPPKERGDLSDVKSGKSALAPEPAAPAFAEPPELRAAILEFDAQWEKLSSSRLCEDACKAFESMRRSAQRICDLVVSGDPRERCRTARSRLDQASRDLAARCADCR
jgi:hypothetical protein